MYYLFKYKNIMPTDYYNMKFGEKVIVKAFIQQEQEELYKISKNKGVFPIIQMR